MSKYDLIQKIVAEIRVQKAEQDAAREAAFFTALKNPKYAAAEKKVRELTVQLGKATYDELNTAPFKNKLANATAERDKLFTGYSPAKAPVCPKCGNNGYVKNKLCSCVLKKYTQRLSDISGISQNIPKTFSAKLATVFDDKITRGEMAKVYSKLEQYCQKFPNVKTPNIVLSGATGTGKTFAAQVVAASLLERDFSVMYLTAFSLIQRFKDYIFNFGGVKNIDDILGCDLLIIDDLGTEPIIKNVTQEYLYNVINERLTNEKSFLITTNLDPDTLAARYDQRLASRILSKQTTALIELKGKDLRLN